MTRELAMVHAREGIRVNSLCPYVPALFIPVRLFSMDIFSEWSSEYT